MAAAPICSDFGVQENKVYHCFPVVIHTVKDLSVVNEAEMFFCISLAFSMIQWMLTIWSLVPPPFLNLACTSGSSWFTYLKPGSENSEHYVASMWDEYNCAVVWAFFGFAFLWGWHENWPSSPVPSAVFSKFAGILSAAFPQHHLSGFETAQLEFYHLH